SVRVVRIARDDVSGGDAGCVEVHLGELDFARGEVAVLHCLRETVLVYRLAEIPEVIRGHVGVRLGLPRVLMAFDLPRCRGQPDLHGLRVAREDNGPFSPRRAVTLVDDDVREVVLWIVAEEE